MTVMAKDAKTAKPSTVILQANHTVGLIDTDGLPGGPMAPGDERLVPAEIADRLLADKSIACSIVKQKPEAGE